MSYTSRILVEGYLQRELTENEVAMLVVIIPAVQKWIDRKLNSTFDSGTSSTRYYDGCEGTLDIDPVNTVTAISSYDTYGNAVYAYTTDEYVLEPRNEAVKREIRLHGSRRWPHGAGNIGVTGTFTEYDGGVPQDIVIAATHIAGGVFNAGKTSGSGEAVAEESLEGHTIKYNTSSSSIDTIAASDPVIQIMLDSRKEIMI